MAKNTIKTIEDLPNAKEESKENELLVKLDEAIALLDCIIQSLKKIETNTFKGY